MPTTSPAFDIEAFLREHERKELVRLLFCGSVDDGKSTLIGRLLLDAQAVTADVLEAVERDSRARGATDGALDPSLLTDGLKAEREQGITIDVAYRYFTTPERTFIIADVPGHEQYTRNMATGASNADLAVILVDARQGMTEQTKRHSLIASLLGIRHVVLVVNKMDLVDFSEESFERIRDDFTAFAARLTIDDLHFVPVSALHGDNVVERSTRMPWYEGGTVQHLLNSVHVASDRNLIDFRFPVQYVLRLPEGGRGYCGTVASGKVRPGDEVVVFPSRRRTRVRSIETFDGTLYEAVVDQAVSVTLEDEVDVTRGDMLMHTGNVSHLGATFDAMVVWMDEAPLQPGKEYILRSTTNETTGSVERIRYELDMESLHRRQATELSLNAVGRCALTLTEPIAWDAYDRNRRTGAFILIDRVTHATAGAGMILERRPVEDAEAAQEASVAAPAAFPILWLTGNTGAGKSSVAFGVRDALRAQPDHPASNRVIVLDGDQMRATISESDSLSPDDRRRHNRRVARLAKLLQKQGFLVIVSVIAPFADVRTDISGLCNPRWVYVKRSGLEADDRPYEEPDDPDLTLDHDALSVADSVERLLAFVTGD